MSNEFEVCIPATVSGLIAALASFDQFCVALKLADDLVARVRLVIEELASNTIKYGYCGDCERPIRLRLCIQPTPTLFYEDEARPFDPTLWRQSVDWTAASREQQEGRSGIVLVRGLSSGLAYHRVPDGNQLVITFAPTGV